MFTHWAVDQAGPFLNFHPSTARGHAPTISGRKSVMTTAELERKVLASILLYPHMLDSFRKVRTWFDDRRHKAIFNAMLEARAAYGEIDMLTVTRRLELFNFLDQVGGIAYVSGILDAFDQNDDVLAVLQEWRARR
jgi:replicative DNA helicase